MSDDLNLKQLQSYINILTNNIIYYLQEFDKELDVNKKNNNLDKLNQLLIDYELYYNKQKEKFYVSSEIEKIEYKKKLKKNSKNFKIFGDQIIERKNLLQILSVKTSFVFPKLSIDLGEINKHTLDYSKINSIIKDAKSTYEATKIYLEELENSIRVKPLIDPNDEGYQTYKSYMKKKEQIKKNIC